MGAKRHSQTPKPLTVRGAATRARIVEAAARLVGDRGVAGTSLDDIMAASETSKSQLYHYFTAKHALIYAVVEQQTATVVDFHESVLKTVRSLAEFRKWRDLVVRLNRSRSGVGGCPMGSLASELSDRSEAARKRLADSFRAWEAHFVVAFDAMVEQGELSETVNLRGLATSVLAALQGGLLLAQTTRTSKPLELSLDMAISYVASCRSTPEPAPARRKGGRQRKSTA